MLTVALNQMIKIITLHYYVYKEHNNVKLSVLEGHRYKSNINIEESAV